jgi:LysR family transcriptional regulator, transcriptional activator for dmlA
MDIASLRLFLLIARRRSISAAARELGMSPSLAARHLARLEKDIGVTLFHRTTRKIELTEQGRVLASWAVSTIEGLNDAQEQIDELRGSVRGLVRFACPESLAFRFLPDMIARFFDDYPDVSLTLMTTDGTLELPDDAFDVGIHIGARPTKPVVVRKLLGIEPILCASPDYVARWGAPQEPRQLANHRVLLHSMYHPHEWLFERAGTRIVQEIVTHFQTTNTILLYELAVRGAGIARLTKRLANVDLQQGRLVRLLPAYRCLSGKDEPLSMWLILPHARVSRRTRVFINALVSHLRRIDRKVVDGAL